MGFDYSKFKTPYFEIEVGDASWKTVVKLPEYLIRAVNKVELTEAFFTEDHSGSTQLIISFVESFENKPGFITDLVFDGKQGITTISGDEKKKQSTVPKFLFNERNKVKITWGYLEDKEKSRSYTGIIQQVSTNFSESAVPVTTITCLPWSRGAASQISTKKAVKFGTVKKVSKEGNSIITFEDMKTDKLIRELADKLGMRVIISENLTNETVDKDKQKMWIAGQSFDQFMTRLAKMSGCVYGIETDPTTGKEIIIFIKKQDFEKRTVLADPVLLHWKQPGSILKNIDLNVAFAAPLDASEKAVDENGDVIEDDKKEKRKLMTQYNSGTTKKPQKAVDHSPIGENNPDPSALALKALTNGGATGTVKVTPTTTKQNVTDKAAVGFNTNQHLVSLDFTTIGYPALIPGIVEVSGIGTRYSGKYRLMSVTHSIDSNGYITKCNAVSQWLSTGGVSPEDINKGDEPEQFEERKVLKQRSSDDKPDILSQFQKFMGIK